MMLVTIKDKKWKMEVDIDMLCSIAGKKVFAGFVNQKPTYKVEYHVNKLKKILDLICEYCEPRVIEEVGVLIQFKFPQFYKHYAASIKKYGGFSR